jgi:hypothetical protein
MSRGVSPELVTLMANFAMLPGFKCDGVLTSSEDTEVGRNKGKDQTDQSHEAQSMSVRIVGERFRWGLHAADLNKTAERIYLPHHISPIILLKLRVQSYIILCHVGPKVNWDDTKNRSRVPSYSINAMSWAYDPFFDSFTNSNMTKNYVTFNSLLEEVNFQEIVGSVHVSSVAVLPGK